MEPGYKGRLLLLESKIRNYIQENRSFLIYAFVILILSFSYELFYFTRSMDDEGFLFDELQHNNWLLQGRWGMYLLSFVINNASVPFVPLFLSLCFSLIAFCIIFHQADRTLRYLLLPLFIACPVWYFVYTFTSLTFGIGVAMLAAALAFRFEQLGWKYFILSVLCGAFSIACYQAMVPVLLLLFAFALLCFLRKDDFSWSGFFKEVLRCACVTLGALGLYFLLNRLFLIGAGTTSQEYIGSFVHLPTPDALKEFLGVLSGNILKYYSGSAAIYGTVLFFMPVLIIVALLAVIFNIPFRKKQGVRNILFLTMLAGVFLIPFSLNLLNSLLMPARTMIAFVLVLPVLLFFAWGFAGHSLRFLLIGLTVLVSINYMFANNRLAYANTIALERDNIMVSRLLNKMDELSFPEDMTSIPLVVMGTPDSFYYAHGPSPILQRETIGSSSFLFGNDIKLPHILDYMMNVGGKRFRIGTQEEYRTVLGDCLGMPCFPQKGSVAFVQGILIMKFAEQFTPVQIDRYKLPFSISYRSEPACGIDERTDSLAGFTPVFTVDMLDFTVRQHIRRVTDLENGRGVRLKIDGNDPIFFIPPIFIGDGSAYALELQCYFERPDVMEIFYKKKPGDEYSEDCKINIQLKKGETHIILNMPTQFLVNGLRIDPGSSNTNVELRELTIWKEENAK